MRCECEVAGFCARYQRSMYGRNWELCQGINVDIGTAAAFREQWLREAGIRSVSVQRKILLKTSQAPGDAVAMTAAIYSLHRAHPGRFLTAVESLYPEVFEGNPYVVEADSSFEPLQMHYPAIHECNTRGIHFMQGWCEFLATALEVSVPLLTNKPLLYSCAVEWRPDYWIICSGGKNDFTNKLWDGYQEVVDSSCARFIQIGVDQAPLRGVENRVGQTSLRQLFDLVAGARGVLCGVSLLMHVAAALEKPAIVIAGGREPVQWNTYPKQHYLHTIGMLPCCTSGGCWKARVKPLNDGTALDESLCERPTPSGPECMTRIEPEEVIYLMRRLHRQSSINICSSESFAASAKSKSSSA